MAGKFVSPKAKESLMTDILVKLFVKDYKDVEKVSVRTAYGVLASGVGIFCNVLLTIAKMVIGILLHSVSVTADAFNNLSDAGSSIIGMIGVKMAEKPADKEHPFGHVSPEINLLGKTVDEAVAELDKYLDDAYIAHLSPVRIVHGKGTGALRNGIHQYLRRQKHIKSFRLGAFGEGDAGVTIVEFK